MDSAGGVGLPRTHSGKQKDSKLGSSAHPNELHNKRIVLCENAMNTTVAKTFERLGEPPCARTHPHAHPLV